MATDEKIPPVNYTGDVPCDCCGSMTVCDKCETDPKVAELMHRLLWIDNDNPMDESLGGHVHLCYPCTKSGCNFHEPNGEGEKCGDFDEDWITVGPPLKKENN
jgi:hypothetical protein